MNTAYRPFGSFRLTLALAVVVSHSTPLEAPGSFLAAIGIGNIAVMGFFVLSGFIITEAAATFYRDRPGAFLSNRFWRIAPPFWAALLVSIAIHFVLVRAGIFQTTDVGTPTEAMFTARNIWSNVIAIFPRPRPLQVDVPGGYYGFVRFSWAVYIEVAFYLVTFATMAVIAVVGRHRKVTEAALAILLVAHVVNEYIRPFSLHWEMAFTPYFALGVCLYGVAERNSRWAFVGAAVSYALAALHFSRYVQGKADIGAAWFKALFEPAYLVPVVTFLLVPFLILLLAGMRISGRIKFLDQRWGDLTYPIYLNHFVVLVVAFSLDWRFHGVTLLVAVLSIALSWLLVAGIEKPLKPLRDRIRGRDLVSSKGEPAVGGHSSDPSPA